MSKIYILLLSVSLIAFISSCKKNQPAPSYVYIPEIRVNSNYAQHGSNSSKITNVKVYNGNQLIGVYELPINVPFIDFSQSKIRCLALIENYGFSSQIQDYVFYEFSENDIFHESNKQDTIHPVVSYISTSSADYWYEDFESFGHSFVQGQNSNAPLVITENSNEVYEGSGSGKFELLTDSSYSKYLTEEEFVYPSNKPAYLEIDYQNNQEFFFSLIIDAENQARYKMPVYQFNPTIDSNGQLYWNKLYIDLGSLLNGIVDLEKFELCFEVQRNTSVSNSVVLIDNVKVIRAK